jgi:hypothetical protein
LAFSAYFSFFIPYYSAVTSMLKICLRRSSFRSKLTYGQLRSLQNLIVGVAKETLEGEHRVALTPIHVAKLKKNGATINIEKGLIAQPYFTLKVLNDCDYYFSRRSHFTKYH